MTSDVVPPLCVSPEPKWLLDRRKELKGFPIVPPEHQDKPLHWVENLDGRREVWKWRSSDGTWQAIGVRAANPSLDNWTYGSRYLGPAEYGDQVADTDGLAKESMTLLEERCAEAAYRTAITDVAALGARVADLESQRHCFIERIAELEAAGQAIESDFNALREVNENLLRNIDRMRDYTAAVTAERDALRTELAQRKAIPANALGYSPRWR